MKTSPRNGAACLGLILFGLVSGLHGQTPIFARERISQAYGKLPLAFEENRGQADARVKFLSRGMGHTLFLTSDEAVLAFPANSGTAPAFDEPARQDVRHKSAQGVLRMRFAGGKARPEIAGLDRLLGASNYLLGSNAARWRTNVASYRKVQYRDLYPGVTLLYYGNQRELEYDLVIAPGSDPHRIRLAIHGAESIKVDARGDLVLRVAGNEVRFRKPLLYQETANGPLEIAGGYAMRGRNEVGFDVGAYDTSRTLVIDPVLVYSTYLGGTENDRAYAIAVDFAGNAYITGATSSADFPLRNPLQSAPNGSGGTDVFVAKLNAAGSALVYSTYIGGNTYDYGEAIAVDSAGNAYVTGYTASTDFPVANPFQATLQGSFDAFVLKLDASGWVLTYSTHLGGTAEDAGYGIAVDAAGSAYVTGWTDSTDFPTASPLRSTNGGNDKADAFITKLNPSGSGLVYSTYMGGSDSDYGYGIAVDGSGNAYITGITYSSNYPTAAATQNSSAGAPDAFVTAVNSAGTAYIYSTYFGGASGDAGEAITTDAAENAYVTGFTNSANFRNAGGLQPAVAGEYDAFVFKLNHSGTPAYSTYLGGAGDDKAFGIAVDGAGNAYVAGFTVSPDFPTSDAAQVLRPGDVETFVACVNPSGSALVYSTYLGGAGWDTAYGITSDAVGNVYIAGMTASSDWPTVSPLQPVYQGNTDAFVAKILAGTPAIYAAAVMNAASFTSQVVPGSIATLFGSGLASDTQQAAGLPLPTTLAGTSMTIDGLPVPLFYVSPTQINFQVPWDVSSGPVPLIVTTSAGTANTLIIMATTIAPAVFSTASSGSGQAFAVIANTTTFAAPAESIADVDARPVFQAESITIYATGLGPVTNAPPAGQAAGDSPLSKTKNTCTVIIGSTAAYVTYCGLAPGFVGLYQINVVVPSSATVGSAENLVLYVAGVTSNTVTIAVQAGTPAIYAETVVNAASYATEAVPGSIATLFGSGLASDTQQAASLPLPTTLAGTSMTINGLPVPLFYVSPSQINFQVPWYVGSGPLPLVVTTSAGTSNTLIITAAGIAPAVFTTASSGTGQAVAVIANTTTFAAPAGSIAGFDARPAYQGESITIYATGLGAVTSTPPAGQAAGDSPSSTGNTCVVTIDATAADVTYCGLAPGFVGLYQINAVVPSSATVGDANNLVLSVGGVSSNTVTIAVQAAPSS